ncbi:BTAD domain-containing putative transcriptional regulator [Salinispora sp. H7-4]|uniref:AfsR/SARP family transcriptional regulator n=1 Tax=Salinispora sp. H7-4 TaxID=2748321 RepID=UPI0015D34F9E|nr:BTAD domain-containing putative transcriptional regulator [Salinispora sp. H7-4]NYT95308.1 AfsR/SARP family transcriptional regulator [Salinispora sp. H7-4]
MDTVRIRLLGPVTAYRDTVEMPLGPSRQRAVLGYLALHRGQPVPLGAITRAVWGDDAPVSGEHLVRTYVARLRRALEPGTPPRARTNVIASVPGGYRLDVPPERVDASHFRHLLGAARSRQAAGSPHDAFHLLTRALELWQDPTLADLGGLLASPRHLTALRRDWVDAGLRHIEVGLRLGQASAVLPVGERLAAVEPLQETVQARYLEALTRSGQRAAAVHHFLDVRARLRAELGVEPGPELRRLYAALLHAGDEPQPPAGAPATVAVVEPDPRHRWCGPGPPIGPLIGREDDLSRCATLLVAHRHVTVVGPAGCGKSATGLTVAERVAGAFPDGVATVDAAEARDCGEVLRLLAETLELPPDADPLHAVGQQRVLLVLNDVEHLGARAGEMVDYALRRCRGAAMLVTSRRRLGLTHEAVFRLAPLALPDLDAPETLADNPAVRLFAHRAGLIRPGFRLTPADTVTVARICHGLDGLPLAVELAAACLYTDSLDGVLRRVDHPLDELRPHRRGHPRHHRSLSAALHRSLAMVPPVDLACLARLGVGDRSFSLQEAVTHCAGLVSPDRLPAVLDRLAEESLLAVRPGPDGPRYRMLRTVALAAVAARGSGPGEGHQEFHGIAGNQP